MVTITNPFLLMCLHHVFHPSWKINMNLMPCKTVKTSSVLSVYPFVSSTVIKDLLLTLSSSFYSLVKEIFTRRAWTLVDNWNMHAVIHRDDGKEDSSDDQLDFYEYPSHRFYYALVLFLYRIVLSPSLPWPARSSSRVDERSASYTLSQDVTKHWRSSLETIA